MTADEVWRPVFGYEGIYEVSDQGRVRSLNRVVHRSDGSTQRSSGRILAQKMGKKYLAVGLSKQGVGRVWNIHHLVCEAFHGQKPDAKSVVRHLNGDRLDNRPENLKWGTAAENTADMLAHGNHFSTNKTTCLNGHEYTPENTFRNYRNARCCRICYRARDAEQKAKKRARVLAARPANVCRICSSEFVGYPSAVFCSDDCRKASRRIPFGAPSRKTKKDE